MGHNFEVKKRIVEAGESIVFNQWHAHAGISMEDFLEGLEWVCDDPTTPDGRLTRELGLEDGKLYRLGRAYFTDGSFNGFFDIAQMGTLSRRWEGDARISARDRI